MSILWDDIQEAVCIQRQKQRERVKQETIDLEAAVADLRAAQAAAGPYGGPTPYERRRDRMEAARALGTHTKEQWVWLRDRINCCARCGVTGVPLQKDHIIPVSAGGSDAITNLQPLCKSCNCSKGYSDLADYRPRFDPHWQYRMAGAGL